MDIATVFEWFAEESKSIAEQETEPAQREKFAKLASLWANATAESTSATSLPRPDSAESTGALVDSGCPPRHIGLVRYPPGRIARKVVVGSGAASNLCLVDGCSKSLGS